MLCYLQIVTFLGFIIVKISGGLTIVLNQYLSGKELVYLTDISFLICLYDCQKRSPCLSVNYHTKMHLCVENLARSNSEQGHFLQQSGCLYVDKDGTWDKILSQLGELQKPEFNNVCGPPPPLTDAVVLGNKWTVGGNVLYIYSCTSQPITAAATCLQNGSWSHVQDFCSQTSISGVRTDPTTLAPNSWSSTLPLPRDTTTTTDPQSSTTTEDIRRTSVATFSLMSMPSVVSPITSQGTSAKASSLLTISQQIPSTTSDSVLTSQSTMSESSSSLSSRLSTTTSQETSITTSAWTTSTSPPLTMSESTRSSSVSTTPSTVNPTSLSAICIQPTAPDCGILPYGDYQSCRGCGYYATCAPSGVTTRPCLTGLVWDDSLKICSWTSSTCV